MNIDLQGLFRLRAAVGRFGEMDAAGWWNTQGVLGARGAAVYTRGLPQTHFLARVRVVSAVAAERSRAIYPAAGVATLWSLPPAVERALSFQERDWATNGGQEDLREFASAVSSSPSSDLPGWLVELGLVSPSVVNEATSLRTEPGGKGIEMRGPVSDETIQLLAVGHGHGGPKSLIVPFIRGGLESDVG